MRPTELASCSTHLTEKSDQSEPSTARVDSAVGSVVGSGQRRETKGTLSAARHVTRGGEGANGRRSSRRPGRQTGLGGGVKGVCEEGV